MLTKILKTILIILLILFPVLGGILVLSSHTPYTEGNSMANFVLIYAAFAFVAVFVLIWITRKYQHLFVQPVLPGVILFGVGLVMMGIAGLAAPPDLTIKMLDHPEREHFRYIVLFVGAVLFGFYFLQVWSKNSLQLSTTFKGLLLVMTSLIMIEMIWEFSHHYHYPEGLKAWVDAGNQAEDFNKHYDDSKSMILGAIGRILVYTLMVWLSIRLYKIRRIRIWSPILTAVLCAFGIISAVTYFTYAVVDMEVPKSVEFLFLFFIPGLPFLILYWIGVALLTKSNATSGPATTSLT